MKMNKVKYLGLCATTLLTIAPVANSAVILAGQPIRTETVRADEETTFVSALKAGFSSDVNLTRSQIKDLSTGSFKKAMESDKTFKYSTTTAGEMYKETGQGKDNLSLYDNLEVPFLKLLVKSGAKMGTLATLGTSISMQITGTKLTPAPTSESDLVTKLQGLRAGDQVKVDLSMSDNSTPVKTGSFSINVTVTADPTNKIKLAAPDDITATASSNTADKVAKAADIKDASGNQAFHAEAFGAATDYYYAVDGKNQFAKLNTFNLNVLGNGTGAVVNQLIPIKYTNTIASKFDPSSFVFLNTDNSGKITKIVPTPGPTTFAYVQRKVVVGTPAYPIFRYTTVYQGVSATNTLENGDILAPNSVDQTKLTYVYNDSGSLAKLRDYLNGDFKTDSNGAGKLTAYKDSPTGTKLAITFELPDLTANTSPQNVIAKAFNADTGATSTIKIPVKVTDIPDPSVAPTVTKFPSGDVIVNSRLVTKLDPTSLVAATYVGADNKTRDLPSRYIKVTVENSKGEAVSLNYDGTIPTTTAGTYKVHFVFSNPSDANKNVKKDLTMKVNSADLSAPTITGFKDSAVYNLSNNKQKEVSPLAQILGMGDVKATFVGVDGANHTIDPKNITFDIKNSYGQSVSLNSNNCIPMTTPGTYTITYIWANPDDPTKTTKKSSTLIVNSVVSEPMAAKYSNNQVADPTIDTNTKSFNTLSNISFNLTYTDPNSSTPTTPTTVAVPNNFVDVKVTKDDKEVALTNYAFTPSEGTYTITYKVTNPKDNVITLNYTRTLTVKSASAKPTPNPTPSPSSPTIQYSEGVVWINYVPGYGINLWLNNNYNGGAERNPDGSLRKLQHGTAWKYNAVATYADGSQWYQLGTNQWIPSTYASLTAVASPNTWATVNREGVGTVSYVPGYGINVWSSPDQQTWTKKISHGTAWKYFKVATKNGKTMYNLGGDQWVDGLYFFPNS
ncbi:hypothetical protein [Xylocopilactobacillus apicola]|uniref:Surface layer protein A domain-containing protein n=1 Tax=Xylocopilactobacillus apicola TaxID=2932184 RepID=A0AAU9DPC2_9LACO|nr:hypothetical protein [Xylocopilactobacillus apicola]BDR58992.1 hypothetical protein XA3_14330 [Xylocopilactobacillus apicola]